jgi:hypothetical protein
MSVTEPEASLMMMLMMLVKTTTKMTTTFDVSFSTTLPSSAGATLLQSAFDWRSVRIHGSHSDKSRR